MGLTALFGIIHGSYCTISTNFYLYLQYYQQNKRISSGITLFRVILDVDKLEHNGLTDILCLLEVPNINGNV